jgi:FtsZ-binding cell division protein ZapB
MIEEVDQFDVLEQRIDSLIESITSLKKENAALAEKAHIQEERLSDLGSQVERMKEARDKAKQRIIALLEKVEQIHM